MTTKSMRFVSALGIGLLLAACARAQAPDEPEDASGTLQVPLRANGRSGIPYQLVDATFSYSGPSTGTIDGGVFGTAEGAAEQIVNTLPVGDYSMVLVDGWNMLQLAAFPPEPVAAELISPNPVTFTILPADTTRVEYAFKVGGEIVDTSSGALSVVLSVDDGLIDDFEDGDANLLALGDRVGSWFVSNDGSGFQSPPAGTAFPTHDGLLTAGAANGLYSMRTFGSGFTGWGAALGVPLNAPDGLALAYRAIGYRGVRFTYRSTGPVRFVVTSQGTQPPPAGTCSANCFDDYGIDLAPSPTTYTTVTLSWLDLAQQGWGTPIPLVYNEVLALIWMLRPGPFDLTIDDVELTQ